MIIFNAVGIGVFAVAVGSAVAIGKLLGFSAEGLIMMVAGLIAMALDLTYRSKSEDGDWISPYGGGALFFLPAWGIGAVWMILGAARTFLPQTNV